MGRQSGGWRSGRDAPSRGKTQADHHGSADATGWSHCRSPASSHQGSPSSYPEGVVQTRSCGYFGGERDDSSLWLWIALPQPCEVRLLVGGETLPPPDAGLRLRERSAPASPGHAAGKATRDEVPRDPAVVHPCSGFRAGLEACPQGPVRRGHAPGRGVGVA